MKKHTKLMFLLAAVSVLALSLAACAGPEGAQGPAGPQGPGPAGADGADGADAVFTADSVTCTECHNDSSLITSKEFAWDESLHGSGEAAAYAGGRDGCTACHSGASFSAMVAEGSTPDTFEGVTGVTRQDCRACHQVHTTYTGEDWALETTDAVDLYAVEGATFDGGKGNLCATCHQPRRGFPEAENGVITGISSHWGPHHGPQSAMLLGVAGGGAEGTPSAHYQMVEDTCVACHMGEGDNHSFEPSIEACVACHTDAENFDIGGVQTEVQAMLDELGALLVAEGVLSDTTVDGHPTVTEAPENVALALYNWIYVAHEDKSLGVHNPSYTIDLLQAGLDALQQ